MRPGQPRLVGPAFTLRFVPAREDLATPASWSNPISTRAAIEAMPEGCIAVVDAMGVTDAGIFGDILCARMTKRGVAALVTDGVVRDVAGVRATGLPVWCQGAAAPPSVAGLTFVAWGEPIGCGGVAVFPDDVVVVDDDGAVLIPAALRRRDRRRGARAGAPRGLDHGGGRARRSAPRALSAQRGEQGALREDQVVTKLNDAKGVYVIAPTPFHPDGRIDESSIDRMTDFFVEAGVDGITVLGQLGEAPKMTHDESVGIVRRVIGAREACRSSSACRRRASRRCARSRRT